MGTCRFCSMKFVWVNLLLVMGLLMPSTLSLGMGQAGPGLPDSPISMDPVDLPPTEVVFVENRGQFPAQVRFQADLPGGVLWLAEDGLWLAQVDWAARRSVALRLTFPEGDGLRFVPLERAPGALHYFRGDPDNWRVDVPRWQGVRVEGVAPGASLELAGGETGLTWRVVGAGGIALRVEGADSVGAFGHGLILATGLGDLRLPLSAAPMGEETVRLLPAIPAARAASLPMAPAATLFGSYLGGSGADDALAMALGSDGSVYVAGETGSVDFPRTIGPNTLNGRWWDAFVTRLTGDGKTLIYSAYLGGSYDGNADEEYASAIAVDALGNAYLTGITASADFPTTPGAFDTSFNGPIASVQYGDAFVTKLSPGGELLYSTYLGGTGRMLSGARRFEDQGAAIALHQGRIYVAGHTNSVDFPTTDNAYDRGYADAQGSLPDAFLSVLDPAGNGASDLLYSTFFGNSNSVQAHALAVDSGGVAYLTGRVYGSATDFPITPGAFAGTRADDHAAFVAKINPAGGGAGDLIYSTYLDGSGYDVGYGVAVDAAGQIYVTGATRSPDFPTTPGGFDTTCGNDGACDSGRFDAFVVKINPGGQGAADLSYGTFLGGGGNEGSHYDLTDNFGGIALAPGGDLLLTGFTASSDYPVTGDAQQNFRMGESDAFLTRLRVQGQGAADLIYSTFLGGDGGHSVAAVGDQGACVAGRALFGDALTTPGAYDTSYNGGGDGFVTCVAVPPQPDLAASTKQVTPAQAAAGEVVTFTVSLVNLGSAAASTTVTDTLPATLALRGTPTSSAAPQPTVAGQTLTWAGTVPAGGTVTLTYQTELISATESATEAAPVAINLALIGDGRGNVYTRRAVVNGYPIFLPLVVAGSSSRRSVHVAE